MDLDKLRFENLLDDISLIDVENLSDEELKNLSRAVINLGLGLNNELVRRASKKEVVE